MSVWGKVIGGVAGFAIGGPLGGILGLVGGHAVDKMRGGGKGIRDSLDARQVAFTTAVIVLSAKMAKADGTVSREEVDAFKQIFKIPPGEMQAVGRLFDEARREAGGFEPYAEQIATMFRSEPAMLEELLAGLFHIAKADGAVHPAEMDYLRKVARIFGMTEATFDRVRAGFQDSGDPDPYQVLGVKAEDSNEDIKAAYRKLIRENHPDTLASQGLPQEFIDLANEKMATINAAYDKIEKIRGMK